MTTEHQPATFTYAGYSTDQLKMAFDQVKNKSHWKNPVSATIFEDDLNIVSAAVAFYTGSNVEVTRTYKNGKVRIYAAGYFNAIGA